MKQRNFAFDMIRIMACMLVVLVHVSAVGVNQEAIHSMAYQISNVYNCLGIVGVPLFFMLSGALLLPERKNSISIKDFYKKHCLKILFVFFLTVFFYNCIAFLLSEQGGTLEQFKEEVLIATLCAEGKGIGHLWFLKDIFCLYLITPILQKAFREEKECRYFLILFLMISIVLNSLVKFPLKYERIVVSLRNAFPFDLIAGYTGYYVLGHYITQFYKPLKNKWKWITLIGVLGFVCTCVCQGLSAYHNSNADAFNDPFFIGHFLTASSLFCLFIQVWKEHSVSSRKLSNLADMTLGIYLIHPLIIQSILYLGIWELPIPGLLLIPVMTIAVTAICAIILIPVQLIKAYNGK